MSTDPAYYPSTGSIDALIPDQAAVVAYNKKQDLAGTPTASTQLARQQDPPGLLGTVFDFAKAAGNMAWAAPAGLVGALTSPLDDNHGLGDQIAAGWKATTQTVGSGWSDLSEGMFGVMNMPIVGPVLQADAWAADKITHAAAFGLLSDNKQKKDESVWDSIVRNWNDTAGVSVGQALLTTPNTTFYGLFMPSSSDDRIPNLSGPSMKDAFNLTHNLLNKATPDDGSSPLGGVAAGTFNFTSIGNTLLPFAGDSFDVKDAQQRANAFHANAFGMVTSGVLDGLWSWYTDPLARATAGVGNVARLARGIDQLKPGEVAAFTKQAEDAAAQAGSADTLTSVLKTGVAPDRAVSTAGTPLASTPKFGKLTIDQLAESGGIKAFAQWASRVSDPLVIQKRLNINDAAAHALAEATTDEQVTRIVRLGLGDVSVIGDFNREMGDLNEGIKRMQPAYKDLGTRLEMMQATKPPISSTAPFDGLRYQDMLDEMEKEYQQVGAELKAMNERHTIVASYMGKGVDTPAIPGSMQQLSPSQWGFLERTRAVRAEVAAVRDSAAEFSGAADSLGLSLPGVLKKVPGLDAKLTPALQAGDAWVVKTYQRSMLSRPITMIGHALDRMPDGHINIQNDNVAEKIVTAMRNVRTPDGLVFNDDDITHIKGMLNGALTPADKQQAINLVEHEAVMRAGKNISTNSPKIARAKDATDNALAGKTENVGADGEHIVSDPEAQWKATQYALDHAFQQYQLMKDTTKQQIVRGSYAPTAEDAGVLVVDPQLRTQLQNNHQFVDLQGWADHLYDKYRNDPDGRLASLAKEGGHYAMAAADTFTKVWKASVLLRLAYTPRTQLDEQLRMAALSHGAAQRLGLSDGVPNFLSNTNARLRYAGSLAARAVARREDSWVQKLRSDLGLPDVSLKTPQQYEDLAKSFDDHATEVDGMANHLDYTRKEITALYEKAKAERTTTPEVKDLQAAPETLHSVKEIDARRDYEMANPDEHEMKFAQDPKVLATREFSPNEEHVAELRAQAEQARATAAQIRDRSTWLRDKSSPNRPTIARSGQGWFELAPGKWEKDSFNTSDAMGPEASLFSSETARDAASRDLLGHVAQERMRLASHATSPRNTIPPNDPGHLNHWLVNIGQITSDPVARMVTKGMDDQKILQWTYDTSEGRMWARETNMIGGSEAERMQSIRSIVNSYLPPESALRDKALEGSLTKQDLIDAYPNMMDRPDLHTPSIHANIRTPANIGMAALNKAVDKTFEFLASKPSDILSRSTGYRWQYQQSMRRQYEIMDAQRQAANDAARRVNPDMLDDGVSITDMNRMRIQAHKEGARFVEQQLYNGKNTSNAAYFMRSILPFAPAWEDAMRAWTRIGFNHPEILQRANQLWNAPNVGAQAERDSQGRPVGGDSLYEVVDANGNLVGPNSNVPGNSQYIVFHPGEALIRHAPNIGGLKGLLTALPNFKIAKGAFNSIMEGNPVWLPGAGPIVAIPMNMLATSGKLDDPDNNALLQWALPLGAQSSNLDMVLPTTVRNALRAIHGDTDPQFSRTIAAIYQSLKMHAIATGEPLPTVRQAEEGARMYWIWRGFQGMVAPIQSTMQQDTAMYSDLYREYKKVYGNQADQKFLIDFPDYFDVAAVSLSKNNGGVPADPRADAVLRNHPELADKIGNIDSHLLGLMATAGLTGFKFSKAEYIWQQNTPVVPGSNTMIRGTQSADDADTSVAARRGWIEYKNLADVVAVALKRRGLSSLTQVGAEDLAKAKKDWVDSQYYSNKNWWNAYQQHDGAKATNILGAVKAMLTDPSYMADKGSTPEVAALATYMQLHDRMIGMLRSRQAEGGSATLTAQANQDLSDQWTSVMNNLRTNDVFDGMYVRYLEHDPFSRTMAELNAG